LVDSEEFVPVAVENHLCDDFCGLVVGKLHFFRGDELSASMLDDNSNGNRLFVCLETKRDAYAATPMDYLAASDQRSRLE
jgi:hypothetical protein